MQSTKKFGVAAGISALALSAGVLTIWAGVEGELPWQQAAEDVAVGLAEARADDTGASAPKLGGELDRDAVAEELHPSNPAKRIAPFGDSYQWEDGLKVTVGEIEDFEPVNTDLDGPYIAYEVEVVNDSEFVYDANYLYSTLASGGVEGDQIFGSVNGVTPPSVAILPGESLTFTQAWAVEDPSDVTLTLTPDGSYFMDYHWTTDVEDDLGDTWGDGAHGIPDEYLPEDDS